jgi:hypothetical protein
MESQFATPTSIFRILRAMLGDRRLLAEPDDGFWVSGEVFGGFGYDINC